MSWINDLVELFSGLLNGLKYEIRRIEFQENTLLAPDGYSVRIKVVNSSQLCLSISEMRLWINDVECERCCEDLARMKAGEVYTFCVRFKASNNIARSGKYQLLFMDSRGRKKSFKGCFPI